MTGIEPRPQKWEVRVLPLCHRGPLNGMGIMTGTARYNVKITLVTYDLVQMNLGAA